MAIRSSAIAVIGLLWLVVAVGWAQADELKDTQALDGLHSAKGVFMIDINDPGRVSHALNVIERTHEGMQKQEVTPQIIVVVIGPAVAFLTKDRRGIPYMQERAVAQVQKTIHKLKTLGVRTEACGVALKGMDVAPGDVIADVQPVGNGFISAIGYQAQGYSLVPVF